MAFGVYPSVTLAQARKRRDDARALLVKGTAPNEAKRTSKVEAEAAAANAVEPIGRAWLALREDGWMEPGPLHPRAAQPGERPVPAPWHASHRRSGARPNCCV